MSGGQQQIERSREIIHIRTQMNECAEHWMCRGLFGSVPVQ